MEQTTQQINQKPTLPIKTKVAAWWMILLGGLTIIEGFIFIFPGGLTGDITDIFIFIFIISIFLFFMMKWNILKTIGEIGIGYTPRMDYNGWLFQLVKMQLSWK